MTNGMTPDQIKEAERFDASLEENEEMQEQDDDDLDDDLDDDQARVREAYETLSEIYMAAMKGPADFHVPTPGGGRKTRPVAELLQDVDDDLLHELFGVFRDAAEGHDVHLRAKLLRTEIVERHADCYAEINVYGAAP